ncbi:hypothetical protein KY363_06310 [Candidatus Woesearchaeota archaeon]|nr:hypothetical protein [Candidatus Woesearchaeota archaeon]
MRLQTMLRTANMLLIVLVIATSVLAQTVPTQPEGPTTIDVLNSTRRTAAGAATIPALAGNVTELSIVANTVTQTWQAYYGNITGTITLDDAMNNTIYNWALAEPEGEIYASEAPIDFTYGNIFCYDFEANDAGYSAFNTLAEYEALLGLQGDDVDGINETFTEGTNYDPFYVGSWHVDSTCPTTQMFDQNEEKDPDKFQEMLLYDNTSNRLVYTAIIEQDALGIGGRGWDFEMIVGENGHDGDSAATAYYFYVELE